MAGEDLQITAVGSFIIQAGDYDFTILVNGEKVYEQNGTYDYMGYETVELDEFIPVMKGDEFAVILSGEDFDNRDELMTQLKRSVEENASRGEVTVSVGISAFERENDMRLQDVFERADKEMYRQKKSCR